MLREVSDRLAFLNYLVGSLSGTLSGKLNTARIPLKTLRDDEVALTQKRNVCIGMENQISRLEHTQERGNERHIAELKEQLARAEKDKEPFEKDHEILVRKALRDSEQQKFQALREVSGLLSAPVPKAYHPSSFRSQYGEKLALLAQAADSVLAILPSIPPSPDRPYAGTEETGTIRACLQHSMDNWKPGQATLSTPAVANLDRSHTRSFGVTHAGELQKINTGERQSTSQANLPPASPHLGGSVEPERESSSGGAPSTSPAPAPIPAQDSGPTTTPATSLAKDSAIDTAVGGNEPTPSAAPPIATTSPGPVDTDPKGPSLAPAVAVAETGESSSGTVPKPYESAEEEKKRLEREERERLLRGGGPSSGPSAPIYESAEERLGREESEKLLQAEHGDGAEAPPPYPDI